MENNISSPSLGYKSHHDVLTSPEGKVYYAAFIVPRAPLILIRAVAAAWDIAGQQLWAHGCVTALQATQAKFDIIEYELGQVERQLIGKLGCPVERGYLYDHRGKTGRIPLAFWEGFTKEEWEKRPQA